MENEVKYLYLDDIIPNRFQPRENFDEQALKELAVSIKEHGVIQPIVVRQIGQKYEIIAGERRYKASTMAGLTKIPAIINNLDDKESSKVALIENLQRRDLTPIEEARTYQKILELDALTQEDLARTMGKSQSAVSNKLRLLTLTEEVQDALLHEQISERHARSLLNVQDPKTQIDLLNKVINTRMTVRELDQEIKKLTDVNNLNSTQNINNEQNTQQQSNIQTTITPTEIDIDSIKNNAVDIQNSINSSQLNNNENISIPNNDIENDTSELNTSFIPTFNSSEGVQQQNNNNDVIGGGLLAGMPVQNNINLPIPNIETQNIAEENVQSNNLYQNFMNDSVPQPEQPMANTNINNNLFGNIEPSNKEPVQNPNAEPNVSEAVNKIKSTIDTIKQTGKNVDVEEFDFDDFYQIVIRVDKQN